MRRQVVDRKEGRKPHEALRTLARCDALLSAIYATVSRPFDPPKTGKIAVNVINHYGDEVLKAFGV